MRKASGSGVVAVLKGEKTVRHIAQRRAVERLATTDLAGPGQQMGERFELIIRTGKKKFVVFTADENHFLGRQPAVVAESAQVGMARGRGWIQRNGYRRGPGNVGGIAGQTVTDVHGALHTVRGQNGSGVKTRSGLQKAPHQIREPLVAPLERQQPAAGQAQRTGREETVSGVGCAATRETPALPFPNGEEIQ
jgi:hypothetical protein